MMTENNGDAGMNQYGEDVRESERYAENEQREWDPDTTLGGYDNPLSLYEWMDRLPPGDEAVSFEDSMAAKYPLIDREYPFHD